MVFDVWCVMCGVWCAEGTTLLKRQGPLCDVWWCGGVAVWLCGSAVVWWFGGVVVWWCGVAWLCGCVVVRW